MVAFDFIQLHCTLLQLSNLYTLFPFLCPTLLEYQYNGTLGKGGGWYANCNSVVKKTGVLPTKNVADRARLLLALLHMLDSLCKNSLQSEGSSFSHPALLEVG